MLANIVQNLIKHIEAQHSQENGRNVDYGLHGKFTARREDTTHTALYTSLEFGATIMYFTPRRSASFGRGPVSNTFDEQAKVAKSAKELLHRLADGKYKIHFSEFDPSDFRINIDGPSLELQEEVAEVNKLFGLPAAETYGL